MKNPFWLALGAINFVAALYAVVQVTLSANSLYDELLTIQQNVAAFDVRLDEMRAQEVRLEELKSELEAIEERITINNIALSNAVEATEAEVVERNAEVVERLSVLESALTNTPVQESLSGATIREVVCIPLDQRILL